MAAIKEVAVNYGAIDRVIHRLAFRSEVVCSTAVDLENLLFSSTFADVEIERPVFVTSLPRAGTTLLLEILHRAPETASHTYRDMPFVRAPILWSRIGSRFRQQAEKRERAHGDGLAIGFDSPEAFEEVVWRGLCPERNGGQGELSIWAENRVGDDAAKSFREHVQKIIALRRPDRKATARYVSKNNSNIRRLGPIGRLFPDAYFLVPFRHPLEHSISMLRQHLHFMELHRSQPFVMEYMADLGHFEFGELHRPIAFPALRELTSAQDPKEVDYWLGYWIAAFEYLWSRRDEVVFVSYEGLCAGGGSAVRQIFSHLGIAGGDSPESAVGIVRSAPATRGQRYSPDPALVAQADDLHERLLGAQLFRSPEVVTRP